MNCKIVWWVFMRNCVIMRNVTNRLKVRRRKNDTNDNRMRNVPHKLGGCEKIRTKAKIFCSEIIINSRKFLLWTLFVIYHCLATLRSIYQFSHFLTNKKTSCLFHFHSFSSLLSRIKQTEKIKHSIT
jgi:hypothetical protein